MTNPGDVEASKLVTSWSFGKGVVNHQQVGGTWTEGDEIVSLSLSSDLNIFDKRVGDRPSRIIRVGYISRISFFRPNTMSSGPSKSGDYSPPNRTRNFLDGYS